MVEKGHRRALVVLGGVTIAESQRPLRVLETSQAPTSRDRAPRYPELRDHVAFYPQRVDECRLGDEGPFKGGPGSRGW